MLIFKSTTTIKDKPRQKTFPGCTIRNTPSEPIHCIVWAKFLFGQLFGEPDDEQQVSPDAADPELANGQESENKGNRLQSLPVKPYKILLVGNIARVNTTEWAEKNDWDPVLLFDKFFNEDIGQLLKMSKLWEKGGRKKPTPLVYKDIVSILYLQIIRKINCYSGWRRRCSKYWLNNGTTDDERKYKRLA